MRAVFVSLLLFALGCEEEAEPGFELNARRIAELANATCSCSDSVSNQSCAESYQEQLQATLVAQIDAGRVVVDGARWGDCIEQLLECDSTPRACDTVFEGALGEGDGCFDDSECAPGLRCELDDPASDGDCSMSGSCVEIEEIGHGDRCDPAADQCEDEDDVCGVATSGDDEGEYVCRAPLRRGDACPIEDFGLDALRLCESGASCLPDGSEVVCARAADEGESCSFMLVEPSLLIRGPCKNGLFCGGSGSCEPYPFPAGEDVGGDCVHRADCLPGLVCLDDECARPLPNGSECDGEDQCVAVCADGECAPGFVACELQ